jgi:hypothetical protein
MGIESSPGRDRPTLTEQGITPAIQAALSPSTNRRLRRGFSSAAVQTHGGTEMFMWDITVILGLLITAVGAAIAASGALIGKITTDELSGTNREEDLTLKVALLKRSRTMATGLGLIAIGAFLQMVPILWGLSHYS